MGRKETKKATPAVHAAPKRSRLGSKCNVDSCLSLLSSDDDKINDIFGESFDTVCVKSREYQSNPNAELGGPEDAVCDVAECFDLLNVALPNEDNKLKDIVINEFQAICYGTASGSAQATDRQGTTATTDAAGCRDQIRCSAIPETCSNARWWRLEDSVGIGVEQRRSRA